MEHVRQTAKMSTSRGLYIILSTELSLALLPLQCFVFEPEEAIRCERFVEEQQVFRLCRFAIVLDDFKSLFGLLKPPVTHENETISSLITSFRYNIPVVFGL